MAWHGVISCGMVCYTYWYGMVIGMVWYGMVWYGMVWYGMVWGIGMGLLLWYGMTWYSVVVHGIVLYAVS